jgi:hypothetical protein
MREVFPCFPIKSAIAERLKCSARASQQAHAKSKGSSATVGPGYFQAPFQPPPLFQGDTLAVYALMPSARASDSVYITAGGPRGGQLSTSNSLFLLCFTLTPYDVPFFQR